VTAIPAFCNDRIDPLKLPDILLAMLAKYPAFLFGPRYAAATGRSLLSSYRRQGIFAMSFFCISTLLTMFIGTATNLLVTSGLVKATLGLDLHAILVAGIISMAAMGLLILGHYHWLDLVIKILVAFLTCATFLAAVISLPMIEWSVAVMWLPSSFDLTAILFVAALLGFMPAPLDVSVWQSQWTVAKIRDTGYSPTRGEAQLDFNIGYAATLVLALCFVVLGTAVMHGSGAQFERSPVRFASQVIALYGETLGEWATVVVGLAAIAVMFSTLLTILDGFPRSLANFLLILHGQEEGVKNPVWLEQRRHRYYWGTMFAIVVGSVMMLSFFIARMTFFVDIAATVSFLTAPVFAWLNYRAIQGEEVPQGARPGKALRVWSKLGIAALGGFALLYIYLALIK